MTDSGSSKLQSLAHYISENQDIILKDWEEMLKGGEDQISNLISLSREKFYDHIPQFLDQLHNALLNKHSESEEVATKHGALRWKYGFNLQEVIKEWNRLHDALIKHAGLCEESGRLESSALNRTHKIIADHIQIGIMHSIDEYHKLQNQQAEARMHDLEAALKGKKEEELDQNQNLRQTTHDLRGTLTTLKSGFTLLEEDEVELSGDTPKVINQMSLATNTLGELINDLLALFRLEAEQEEVDIISFNASTVLSDLCESLQPLADTENIDLRCSGEDPLIVQSDEGKLRRITQNLVINSLKYTHQGYVKMSWEQTGDGSWRLKVSDTGPGLDSSSNGTAQVQGEGIGLMIVRKLCNLLDGIISVETGPDEGTVFRIRFPLSTS